MYKQSDVDDATMRIEVHYKTCASYLPELLRRQDPARIRGSGFIQFPPQRPFEQAVIVQPATVAVSYSISFLRLALTKTALQ